MFLDDKEKMRDFVRMTKDDFLMFYGYLTEKEYEDTKKAFTCECCKEKITFDNSPYGANRVENYGYICEDCFANDYFNVCIKCEKTFRNDDFQMFNSGGGYVCEECFKKCYFLELVKVEKDKNSNDFSMLLKEKITSHTFWIDCIENEDGYYSWDFNQYIFHLCDSKDIEAKKMQDFFNRNDNIENFDYLIDCLIYKAVKMGGIKNEN